MNVGARIRDLRIARDLGSRNLARRVGASQSHISRVEHGHQTPSLGMIERIADVLGVTPHDLLADDLSPFVAADPWLADLVPLIPALTVTQREQVLGVLRDL